MIKTGIDIVEISRMANCLERHTNFLSRYFCENEIIMLQAKKSNMMQSVAANFAGKEAFFKAIGTGVSGFSFNEVEILRDEFGAPYFNFFGKVKEFMQENKFIATISLAHEKKYAVASVLLQG